MIHNLTADYSVSLACSLLGIDTNLYYHWLNVTREKETKKSTEDILLREEIERLINLPASSRYGYRPMTYQLKRDGFQINGRFANHKRVLRITRDSNLLCEIKKAFINTTDSDHNLKRYPNLLKRENIKVIGLDQVWVNDITYIRLPEGFVYLAAVIDAYSRKVAGYCLSKKIDKTISTRGSKNGT